MASNNGRDKSLESWIWDAACSIRGAKDAPKYKDYILPLIFTKRLCDVFDDELNRIAKEVGSRKKAFQLAKADHKLVRFYLPLVPADPEQPVWSVIRKLSDKIGEGVTTHMRAIAREKLREFNPRYAEAEGALLGQFRHLHTDIYGNRGRLENLEAYIARYCD